MHQITLGVSYMGEIGCTDQNYTTVLFTQLLVGEFSINFAKMVSIFGFSALTFFVMKIEKIFFLAQIET